jgi:hypothetical protein
MKLYGGFGGFIIVFSGGHSKLLKFIIKHIRHIMFMQKSNESVARFNFVNEMHGHAIINPCLVPGK